MKPLFTLFILIFSLKAMSCPDLSGNYECLADDGYSKPMTIQQDGITFKYKLQSSTWVSIADNVNRKIEDYPGYENVYEQAWCEANKLIIKNVGRVLKRGGGYHGTETAFYTTALEAYGVSFLQKATLVRDGSGEKYYYNMLYECYRKY